MAQVLESLKSKTLRDVSSVQIAINFGQDTGIIVPLSVQQAAYLLTMMGFQLNNGILTYLSDSDVLKIMSPGE